VAGGRVSVAQAWQSGGEDEDGGDATVQEYETRSWGWCGVVCACCKRGASMVGGTDLAGRPTGVG
jgi:hypothetical protein